MLSNSAPGPGLIILSPAGYVVPVHQKAPTGGSGTYGATVVAPVSSEGAVLAPGAGTYPLSTVGGGTGFQL